METHAWLPVEDNDGIDGVDEAMEISRRDRG
jgi:hypothetical protein